MPRGTQVEPFSKVWKIQADFFQALEDFWASFPSVGKWPFIVAPLAFLQALPT
jgi:hypothetical protein